MSAFSNLESELFAPLILLNAFPDFVLSLKKGESPDWHDAKNSIGIEVARTFDEKAGEKIGWSNQYLGKNEKNVPAKIVKKAGKEFVFNSKNELTAVLNIFSSDIIDNCIECATEEAGKKLDKLNNSHFSSYDMNCLFLYLFLPVSKDNICLFFEEYQKRICKYLKFYEHIFLMGFNDVYHLDFLAQSISKKSFSIDEMNEFQKQVHLLEKVSSWGKDADFLEAYRLIVDSESYL